MRGPYSPAQRTAGPGIYTPPTAHRTISTPCPTSPCPAPACPPRRLSLPDRSLVLHTIPWCMMQRGMGPQRPPLSPAHTWVGGRGHVLKAKPAAWALPQIAGQNPETRFSIAKLQFPGTGWDTNPEGPASVGTHFFAPPRISAQKALFVLPLQRAAGQAAASCKHHHLPQQDPPRTQNRWFHFIDIHRYPA